MILPGLLAFLVMAELWRVPFKYVEADVPEIYFEIARSDEEFAVVDLPISRYRDIAKYMFYQTIHEKPIPVGIINRPEAGLRDTTGRIISMLKTKKELDSEMIEALQRYGAGYVILHSFEGESDRVVVRELRNPRP